MEHIEHLEAGGILVLRPGLDSSESESELLMQGGRLIEPNVVLRYPAPHTPQWVSREEAVRLLEHYGGTVTHYG